jgi:hypothetical protein
MASICSVTIGLYGFVTVPWPNRVDVPDGMQR